MKQSNNPYTEKLRLLIEIIEKAETAGNPLPTVDILDSIINLVFLIQDGVIFASENMEVFEHPSGQLDELSNVRMVYKRPQNYALFSTKLEDFVDITLENTILLKRAIVASQRHQRVFADEDYYLRRLVSDNQQILRALESRQSTKRLIQSLYKEYWRDKRYIRKCLRKIKYLQNTLWRKKLVISSLHKRLKKKGRN
jgi:hypothetical protein